MKFLFQTIAIFGVAYFMELLAPWYSIAIVAFIFGYLLRSNASFLAGFLAIALLWLFKMWMIDMDAPESLNLADAVSKIFPLKSKSLLFLVTALIGGLVGGFAAMTGALLKRDKKKGYYY